MCSLEEGREPVASAARSRREVVNYFAGLRFIEKHASKKYIRHADLFDLHRFLTGEVMDQGEAGRYRTIAVRVRRYPPPTPNDFSGVTMQLKAEQRGKMASRFQ